MVLLLPLISLTSLFKGYFIGINQIEKTNFCQVSEELVRLLFIIIFVDIFDKSESLIENFTETDHFKYSVVEFDGKELPALKYEK